MWLVWRQWYTNDHFKVAAEDVPRSKIQNPNDAIVKITTIAISSSDLHMYEGRTAAKPGIIFGHENLGIVEEIGSGVTDIKVGDRVVMSFNIGCAIAETVKNNIRDSVQK